MNTKTNNLILNTDTYKQAHYGFMEPNTTKIFSYVEARKGGEYDVAQFFGLQYFIKKYLLTPITQEMIDEADAFITNNHVPFAFNKDGWQYILDNHAGHLPVRIKAVREGAIIPEGNVLVTIENTDPNCAWLTSFLETILLRAVWYGTTVATRGYTLRNVIREFITKSGTEETDMWKLWDFGQRGVSSHESGVIGGMAHIINSMGTDSIMGILGAQEFYNSNNMLAYSVAASEHSVTVAYGEDGEKQFISNAIDKFGGKGNMISLVSDSYDMYRFVNYVGELKDKIIENGCTVVVRPDSGIPEEVDLEVVERLGKLFGYTVNEKGYKVLHPSVRVIQGDGITETSIKRILHDLTINGWSADNIVFGSGGYLLQSVNRDTLRFAMKASYVEVDGVGKDIFKNPKTDPTKASKKGRITLVQTATGEIQTVKEDEITADMTELLTPVYENGKLLKEWTFEEVREAKLI